MSESPTADADLTGEPHGRPPGEHDSDLPGPADAGGEPDMAEENAETSLDQPSQ